MSGVHGLVLILHTLCPTYPLTASSTILQVSPNSTYFFFSDVLQASFFHEPLPTTYSSLSMLTPSCPPSSSASRSLCFFPPQNSSVSYTELWPAAALILPSQLSGRPGCVYSSDHSSFSSATWQRKKQGSKPPPSPNCRSSPRHLLKSFSTSRSASSTFKIQELVTF